MGINIANLGTNCSPIPKENIRPICHALQIIKDGNQAIHVVLFIKD